MVACGDHHTLVLTQAGEVFACGRGGHGETGNSLLPDIVSVPERVPGLHAMAMVTVGDMFSGAVGVDRQVWMWGKCGRGRLGYPPATPQTLTAAESRSLGLTAFGGLPVVLLNLRTNRAAAVTEPGELWVWGQNTCGKLGLGDDTLRVIPTLVKAGGILAWGGSHVYMVVCGYNHQLVLTLRSHGNRDIRAARHKHNLGHVERAHLVHSGTAICSTGGSRRASRQLPLAVPRLCLWRAALISQLP